MQSIILAINISSADKINSSVSQLLVSALANEKISDVVIYLPQLDERSFSTLCCLAAGIEDSGYVGKTHFFIPEVDKEDISLDALNQFRKCFPRISVCSKESSMKIGDVSFKYFNSKCLYSDELETYINDFYYELKRGDSELCIATDSLEDADILGRISSRVSILNTDDAKAFRSRTTSNHIRLNGDYIDKFDLERTITLARKGEFLYKKNEINIPTDNEKVIKRILEPTTRKKGKV